MDWIEDAPFIVKLLFTLPVLNTFSWSLVRIDNCFSYGEWYHKLFSIILLPLSLTPIAIIDTFHLIFIDHDEVVISDPY